MCRTDPAICTPLKVLFFFFADPQASSVSSTSTALLLLLLLGMALAPQEPGPGEVRAKETFHPGGRDGRHRVRPALAVGSRAPTWWSPAGTGTGTTVLGRRAFFLLLPFLDDEVAAT